MANLIDSTYFIRDISLPAQVLESGGDYEEITTYIEKYEREILLMLLGYELYKALKAQIDAGAPYSAPWKDFIEGVEYTNFSGYTIKWNGLINPDKESFIAYYIYYKYVNDKISDSSGVGMVSSTVENSTKVSPIYKASSAYNKFVELYGMIGDNDFNPSAYNFLLTNEDDYDNWVFTPMKFGNAFGI